MNIVVKRLSELKHYQKNAKKHDEKQVQNVAESIREFGFVQPIVIDRNGVIVIGHCRALAAEKLGINQVPCVCVEDLSAKQVNALRIVDNKSNESEWDFSLLAEELDDIDLSAFEFDFELGGENYSPDEFENDFSLPDGDKPEICQMTFTLHERQKEMIEYAISLVTDGCSETFGNTNKNGNALYEVVKQWAEQRK